MFKKHSAFALPLSLLAIFMTPRPCVAATPSRSFGVSVIVQAGCSVVAPMSYGTYTAAMSNVASSVSVNCTNIAQYRIAVSTGIGAALTVPGAIRAHNLKSGGSAGTAATSSTGNGFSQPMLSYTEPLGNSNAAPNTLSVSITY
jgi:hypothetical protein